MKNSSPAWHSLGHSVLVLAYISLVATIMNNGSKWFGVRDTFLTPIAVLMLFVLSAAITGTLVVGKPVLLYLDGKEKEAVQFFGYTVGWLFLLTVIAFVVMLVK